MIFVSSSCVKYKRISDSVSALADHGFTDIELSGGTEYYDTYLDDLLDLKDRLRLTYRCHNYFPPPPRPFVLNLASLDDEIYETSVDHLKKSIDVSKALGADKFAFHAGYYVDIKTDEIGKSVSRKEHSDKSRAKKRFCDAVWMLKDYAGDFSLYVENNVTSDVNIRTYCGDNPFMVTCADEYAEIASMADIKLLLDTAHLKVSCRSLGLDFADEFARMAGLTDYVHISDNDGFSDQNKGISADSVMYCMLKKYCNDKCDFTIEIYSGINDIVNCYKLVSGINND